MKLDQLISESSVICDAEINSKKKALEQLAELLAMETSDKDAFEIFQHLTEREKLGSTGLGHGVALPHARTDKCDRAIGAFIKLNQGIDFDSPDNEPTDLLFALMVPEEHTSEHLEILAGLASRFSDATLCHSLRSATTAKELYNRLTSWEVASQAS